MAKGFNQVTLMGNLTKDPELKTIPSGQSVCNFSLAINRAWTSKDGQQQDAVDYFDCVAWAKAGEIIAQYAKKGSKILVSGRLQTRTWEDQNGAKRKSIDIIMSDFNFLDSAGGSSYSPDPTSSSEESSSNDKNEEIVSDIDVDKPVDLSEIPF
jgi:single-strand DNA-binding protein